MSGDLIFETAVKLTLEHEGGYVCDPLEIERIESAIRRALFEESARYGGSSQDGMKNLRHTNCTIMGCQRRAYASGLCNAHYIRRRKGQPMSVPVKNRKRGIACIDCGAEPTGKGGWFRCAKHFRIRRRRIVKSALVTSFGARCKHCSNTFPAAVFDFHHTGVKGAAVSYLLDNASISAIAAEAARCYLLCANCHRMEHADDE